MADRILSVKAEKLVERAWEILANDSAYFEKHNDKGFDDILKIYNDLCKCNRAIRDCESEADYTRLSQEVERCEKAINRYS